MLLEQYAVNPTVLDFRECRAESRPLPNKTPSERLCVGCLTVRRSMLCIKGVRFDWTLDTFFDTCSDACHEVKLETRFQIMEVGSVDHDSICTDD